MGSFKENILTMTKENQDFIQSLLTDGLDISNQNNHPLIVIRILWLLDKLSYHEAFFRENKESKIQIIFEKLVDLFICDDNESHISIFAVKYQCLRALYKYTKMISLKKVYAEDQKYMSILDKILCQICDNVLVQCNEETINIPLQTLGYYSQIDQQSTINFLNSVQNNGQQTGVILMSKIAELHQKYYQDGLLGEDVLDLIKI